MLYVPCLYTLTAACVCVCVCTNTTPSSLHTQVSITSHAARYYEFYHIRQSLRKSPQGISDVSQHVRRGLTKVIYGMDYYVTGYF